MTRPAPEPLVLNLAAARMKGTRAEAHERCWADRDLPDSDGITRVCGERAETTLGLCGIHRWLLAPRMLVSRMLVSR